MIYLIYVLIVVALFILELCIKNHIEKTKPLDKEVPIIKDKLYIQYTRNTGAMYSTFEDKSRIICGVSATFLSIMCIVYSYLLTKKGNNLLKLGMSFMLGGGLSNVYDRIKRKYVVDYIYWKRLKKIVFNLADVFISIGAVVGMIGEMINKE